MPGGHEIGIKKTFFQCKSLLKIPLSLIQTPLTKQLQITMEFFFVPLTIAICYSLFKRELKKPTEPRFSKSPSNNKKDVSATPNWLQSWILKYGLEVTENDHDGEYTCRMSCPLKTCRVDIRFVITESIGDFRADIIFPTIVDDVFFSKMNKLLDEFNEHESIHQMLLDKNNGILCLRTEVSGESIRTLNQDDKVQLLHRTFHMSDRVYTETMRVIYGSTLPEIAVMKLLGMRGVLLN